MSVVTDSPPSLEPIDEPVDSVEAAAPPAVESPVHSSGRTRLGEAALAVAAFVLYARRLSINGYGNDYYGAAVRSMTQSWHNFFYGSLDPGGWITVDKQPAALWFHALSARLFGFSTWSILIPSAVCGALSVWLLAITIRRVWGRTAGFVAGAALAVTPALLAVSRSNNPDVTLVVAMVAAAWATERAITTRKARWMIIAGALCGLGFLAKLLAAGLVMPGMWLAYFVASGGSWKRRIGVLALATGAFVGISGVWIAAVQLTPASSRPYIGGSTDGTALDLVFGYNGLGRVSGNERAGAPGGGGGPAGGRPAGNPGGGFGRVGNPGGGFGRVGQGSAGGFTVDEFGGTPGIGRLLNNGMGDQVMWLAPLAATAAIAGGAVALRRRRLDARLGSLVLFVSWVAVTYLVFAYAKGIFHNYYVSLLAPGLAALVGIGAGLAQGTGRIGRIVAAVAIVATAGLQLVLIRRVPAYSWLRVVVPVALGIVAVAWLVSAVRTRLDRRVRLSLIGAATALVLMAPAVWAVDGVRQTQSGTFPDARPRVGGASPFGARAGGGSAGAPGGFGGQGGLSTELLTWLKGQRTTERWLIAVGSSMQASGAIIAGDSVMAMGGFSGSDPAMTPARLADLVAHGELRFVSAGGGGFGGGGLGGGSSISGVVAQVCTSVPASTWGGTGSAVYDCQGQADAIGNAKSATGASPPTPTTGTTPPASTPASGGAPAGGSAPNPGPGAGGAATGQPGFAELEQCLSAQGIDASQGPNFNDPAFQQAMATCAQIPAGRSGTERSGPSSSALTGEAVQRRDTSSRVTSCHVPSAHDRSQAACTLT